MSNQQPPYGQGQPPQGPPPGWGQPPQGPPPGYGPPPQSPPPPQGPPPGYGPPPQGPPPQQGPPPGYGQPPQGPPPGYGPPQGQPGHGQPPYQGQPQQGYPGQQYPGQQGYPGQPPYGGGAPRGGKSNAKILYLAGGALVVVAVIGVVLALIFGGGDDKQVQPPPTTGGGGDNGTNQPTEDGGTDEGIEVGEGVFVKPQPGYLRTELKDFKGVYLLKKGEAYFMVQVFKGEGETADTVLPKLLTAETKGLSSVQTKDPQRKTPGANDKTPVKVLITQSYSALSTGQQGTTEMVGFVGVIERNDGVITLVRVLARKDKASSAQPDSTEMLRSVVKSQ